MELLQTRGVDKEVLFNKEHNLGIGISVGNGWFVPENTYELTKWALEHTKEWVLVYVADIPHSINLEVRNRISSGRAERLAIKRGGEVLKKTKEYILRNLSKEERCKVHFATWADIDKDVYLPMRDFAYEMYKNNLNFKEEIMNIVRGYVKHEKRYFSDEDIENLGKYIVEELPEVMTKIAISGFRFDSYLYPYDGEVVRLVDAIQKGEKFSEIKEYFEKLAPMRGFGVVR